MQGRAQAVGHNSKLFKACCAAGVHISYAQGWPVRILATPPPDPPKFWNPSFSNVRFWGKSAGTKGPEFFF